MKLVAYEVVTVSGAVEASRIVSSPRAKGTLRVAPFSPRELFAAMRIEPPETADDQALRRLGADLAFDAETEAIGVSDLKIVLDDSTLQGGATVAKPTASPAIAFKLSVDAIDLDRYLPPPAEGEEPAAPVPAGGGDEELPIPVEALRALDLDGQLTVGRLKLSNVQMQDVDLTVTAKDGLVQIRPLTLSMYDGRLHATSTVDVRGDTPRYHLTPKLEGVQVGPLLQDYMGNDKLSGATTARLDLTTAGSTVGALKSALDGSLAFEFRNGAVKGFNLRHMIETAEARLKQEAVPEPLTRETDFSAITVSGKVKNGRLTSTDLDALSPFLRVGGDGWVDLAKDALDYTARVKIVGSEEGQGGKGLEELEGLTIPVALKGSFTDLDYDIKIGDALKDAALAKQKEKLEAEKAKLKAEQEAKKKELEAKLEAEKEAEKQELDEKLDKERDKLKDKLKGLF
jgi:AsmA protein